MLKGVLTLVLLELLSRQEDYGYALVLRLQEHGLNDLSEGTVYPALSRLEAQGLLSARLVRSTAGPARKYYSVTPAGTEAKLRARQDWIRLMRAVNSVVPLEETS